MNERSCLYPILGSQIYGWLGEFIDTLSIIATVFGVCTSLGLGVMQLNSGLFIVTDGAFKENINNQMIIIAVVTGIATISVLTGIKNGIRRLAEFTFLLGNIMLLVVFFMDDWKYCLNSLCEVTFYYLQYIVDLGARTDSGAQSIPQFPRVWVQDPGASTYSMTYITPSANVSDYKNFMNGWTIFYWGWWIAWAPFVGTFIAKISRGRTIREFIAATILAPII